MASVCSESDIPRLTGMTAVVTGANSGIGLEVARGLASKGAHVVLAVRRIDRGRAAASTILATSPGAALEAIELDLADLASVHRFADALRSRLGGLDLLINNAGVASASLQRTVEGFELVFGTNHLGHYALTGLLLPTIIASPKRSCGYGDEPGPW
jgi:NAD(P)-dependent dehydrogenase (short-subunit alcohol dehydrogenase family)